MPLTDKQQRFVDQYLIDQNATQAYKRAGYKVRNDHYAQTASSRMMLNDVVREKIDAGLAKLAEAAYMTAAEARKELSIIARCSLQAFLDTSGSEPKMRPANEIHADAWKTLKSVKVRRYVQGQGESARDVEIVEYVLWDKLAANVAVLKALGEIREQIEHTGKNGAPIESTVTVIDTHAKILSFANEFRIAAQRQLDEEAAERNGNLNGDLKEDEDEFSNGNGEAGRHS